MSGPEHIEVPAAGYADEWVHRNGAAEELLAELERLSGARRKRRRLVLSGGALAAVACAGVFFGLSSGFREAPIVAGSPAIVQLPRTEVLPDGSVIELKEDAQIAPRFEPGPGGLRRVELLRGEAHFAVAKDPSRPFVVTAAGVGVRAVGTAFSVSLQRSEVEILVTEGRVALDPPGRTERTGSEAVDALQVEAERLELSAGSRIVVPIVEPGNPAPAIVPAAVETLGLPEITERLSWRLPKLEFSGTPLSEAVEMFNRHNTVQIQLADKELGSLQISGFLRADKTETFVLLLETDFALKSSRDGERIVIRR